MNEEKEERGTDTQRERDADRKRENETDRPMETETERERGRGWPKVARVEYWNALPEAISVRCPPFALLSCPLQASSLPPPASVLSSLPSVPRRASSPQNPRRSPPAPFSRELFAVFLLGTRSIFHLEHRDPRPLILRLPWTRDQAYPSCRRGFPTKAPPPRRPPPRAD